MPGDLPWVLQVDGHTDRRPISNARFPANWELSTARALPAIADETVVLDAMRRPLTPPRR